MTVSAQTPLNRSVGNGVTTVFPYTFKVLAEADMEVSVDGVVKTLTTHYTLSGVGTDSGNVTFLVPPADLAVVVRRRNMAYTRSVDYQDQGELPTDTLDDDQDAPVLMCQQLAEGLGRAVQVPIDETTDPAVLIDSLLTASADAVAAAADTAADVITTAAAAAAAAASAASTGLPALTGEALSLLRVKADETGYEARTPTETRTDIGAAESGVNTTITSLGILPGYLFGCTLSTAGSSATMSVAAGRVTDSTGLQSMGLTAIAKTTSAWAVGTAQGGLDTGTIANNTWYHFYVIRRPDTGVVDVVFSTNATSPTLPANYTQYRRIGSGRTDGSAQWGSFLQDGDNFYWLTPVFDVGATSPGASAVSRTLTTPLGLSVDALLNVALSTNSTDFLILSDLAAVDLAPTISTTTPLATIAVSGATVNACQAKVRTNTSSAIRSRMSVGTGGNGFSIATRGWVDRRGKDA